jgi:hypothetical protein
MAVHMGNPSICRLKDENHVFEAILGYIARYCCKKPKVAESRQNKTKK